MPSWHQGWNHPSFSFSCTNISCNQQIILFWNGTATPIYNLINMANSNPVQSMITFYFNLKEVHHNI